MPDTRTNDTMKILCDMINESLSQLSEQDDIYVLSKTSFLKSLFNNDDEKETFSAQYKWLEGTRNPLLKKMYTMLDRIDDASDLEDILQINICKKSNETEPAVIPCKLYNEFFDIFDRKLTDYLKSEVGSFKERQDNTLGEKIMFFIIHGYFGNTIRRNLPPNINAYADYLPEHKEFQMFLEKNADADCICLNGTDNNMKAGWYIKYLKTKYTDIQIAYIISVSKYTDVLDKIPFAEDDIFSHIIKENFYCRDKARRLKKLTKPLWIILDNFKGSSEECRKICKLTKIGKIKIIFLNSGSKNILKPAYGFTFRALTTEQLTGIFFKVCEKKEVSIEKTGTGSGILNRLSRTVGDSPELMILIAENYCYDFHSSGPASADRFLIELNSSNMTDTSKKYHSGINDEDKKLNGHIKKIFESLSKEDKNLLYTLYLINSAELTVYHVHKWFGINSATIENLSEKGFCYIDGQTLSFAIPPLIIRAFKYDIFKRKKDAIPFLSYLENLITTITKKDVKPIEFEILKQVIISLHNELLSKIQMFPSLTRDISEQKLLCSFHLSCFSFLVQYSDTVSADRLLEDNEIGKKLLKFHVNGFKSAKNILMKLFDNIEKGKTYQLFDLCDIVTLNEDIFNPENISFPYFLDYIEILTRIEILALLTQFATTTDTNITSITTANFRVFCEATYSLFQIYFESCIEKASKCQQPIDASLKILESQRSNDTVLTRMYLLCFITFLSGNIHQCRTEEICLHETKSLKMLSKNLKAESSIQTIELEIALNACFACVYMLKYYTIPENDYDTKKQLMSHMENCLNRLLKARRKTLSLPFSLADLYNCTLIHSTALSRFCLDHLTTDEYRSIQIRNLPRLKMIQDAVNNQLMLSDNLKLIQGFLPANEFYPH